LGGLEVSEATHRAMRVPIVQKKGCAPPKKVMVIDATGGEGRGVGVEFLVQGLAKNALRREGGEIVEQDDKEGRRCHQERIWEKRFCREGR